MWQKFEKFVRAELDSGGPDPQIPTILALADEGQQERVWMAGCYCSHHCVPSAYAVYTCWKPETILDRPYDFMAWLKDSWDHLPVRPEMRSHRMLEKRHECLCDFAQLALNHETLKGIQDFEIAWGYAVENVKYFGRYMAIKFMEIGRQGGFLSVEMPDMRAQGAWSPRMALAMLYPIAKVLGDRDDTSPNAEKVVEEFATLARHHLAMLGIEVSYFQLQVLLCEFKEFMQGTYYPGASLDEEIEYIKKAEERFNMAEVWQVRKELFGLESGK